MVMSSPREAGEKPPSNPEGKLFRLVVVSFGLLCILQAALNISLRLALYSSHSKTSDIEAICKNLTEESDELKRNMRDFALYSQKEWVYFRCSFYYISSIKKTWKESRDYCLQRGADLMIINSKEEQNFTSQFKDRMWIGLTDQEEEGTWKWVDGTLLNTSYWIHDEPNNFELTEEDCTEVRYHKMENSWNDLPCDFPNFWICEKKVL